MNANLMASFSSPDREQSTFDFSVTVEQDASPSSSQQAGSGINLPVASSRGLLGMMKSMVINSRRPTSAAPATSSSVGSSSSSSSKLDTRNYAARWRTTKLVVFELVRGDLDLSSTTATAISAASAGSSTSQAGISSSNKYRRLGRRKGGGGSHNHNHSSGSIVGDKLRKVRALQKGVLKKISWLPEWWWDLVPSMNIQPGEAQTGGKGAAGVVEDVDPEERDALPGHLDGEDNESFLDVEDGSESSSYPAPVVGHPSGSPWALWNDCDAAWLPTDLVRIFFCAFSIRFSSLSTSSSRFRRV